MEVVCITTKHAGTRTIRLSLHICVPPDFAAEALALFPGVVHECTAAEFEAFYDNKAHAHEPEDIIDTDTLNGLAAQRGLMKSLGQDTDALDAKITMALDPANKTENGVRKNVNRRWADVKTARGITVK
jgi:hypothetical protein